MKFSGTKLISMLALSIVLAMSFATCAFAVDATAEGGEVVDPQPEPIPEPTPEPDPVFVKQSVTRAINFTKLTIYKGQTSSYLVMKTTNYVSTNPAIATQTKSTVRSINPANVKYSSANSKIITVAEDGTVTAKAPGYTTITAVHKDVTYTCKVLVLNPLDTKVKKQKGVVKYDAAKGNAIVKKAYKWVGKGKYKAGACKKGYFDCSGFVSYVIAGHRIGNTYSFLTYKKVKNPQPGDICVRSAHAGIYIGSGMMIHAVAPGKGVKIGKVEKGMKYVRIYKK